MGTVLFRKRTVLFRMGMILFPMGTVLFPMGTILFRMETIPFHMGTVLFSMSPKPVCKGATPLSMRAALMGAGVLHFCMETAPEYKRARPFPSALRHPSLRPRRLLP